MSVLTQTLTSVYFTCSNEVKIMDLFFHDGYCYFTQWSGNNQ